MGFNSPLKGVMMSKEISHVGLLMNFVLNFLGVKLEVKA